MQVMHTTIIHRIADVFHIGVCLGTRVENN